jgi:DNA-binding response OmpR family regulator
VARVLIVDDEPAIRLLGRVNLEADGIEVLEAGDGPSGLALAQRELPDLILLDVVLPGLDGRKVAERLRADERTRAVPIVFMSGAGELVDGPAGVDVLAKPFDPVELSRRVGEVLRRSAGRSGA